MHLNSFRIWTIKILAYFSFRFNTIGGALDLSAVGGPKIILPLISPTAQYLTLNAGTNKTLTCEAEYPVTWSLPEIGSSIARHNITMHEMLPPRRGFESRLDLYNVSGYNVGAHFCIVTGYKGTDDFKTPKRATSIYIYVNDPENPLVPFNNLVIVAHHYLEVVIPCKPSSKDGQVELIHQYGIQTNEDIPINEFDIFRNYNANAGFTMLYTLLIQFYICRAKSPENSMERIFYVYNGSRYDIMLECWSSNPELRPPFHELENWFAQMLGDDITNLYIDLNDPHLKVNSEFNMQGRMDYLALMGRPQEVAPKAPQYFNGKLIAKENQSQTDYVQIHPKIENASPQDDDVHADHFSSPVPNSPTISNNLDSQSSENRKKDGIPEEVPMLNKHAGSDSEPDLSPNIVSSTSSPSKQFANLNKSSDSRTSSDNYVNLQNNDPNKLRTKDAFSNPEYLMLQNVNEKRK